MRLYAINEFNLVVFILEHLLGRPVHILCVMPYLPPLDGLLRRTITGLEQRGLATWARDTLPELAFFEKNPAEIKYAHLYPRFEPELSAYYRFLETGLGDYELAFKHAASSWFKFHLGKLPYLEGLAPRLMENEVTLVDLPEDLWECHRIAFDRGLPIRAKRIGVFQRLLNFMTTLTVITAACFNVLKRITLKPPPIRRFALGADLAQEGVREFFLQIAEKPEEILFVLRHPEARLELDAGRLDTYRHATLGDGWYLPGAGLFAMMTAIVDSLLLLRRLSWAPSGLFFNVAKLVNKRVVFRAFFNCHQFVGFLARDEYNTEHIIRTQELRRAGIKSMGLTHGMSTGPRVFPHMRYLDFDLLYVFGKRQHEAYAETWPASMAIRPIGTFRLTREQWTRARGPRNRDIVIFANQDTDPPAHIEITRQIAAAFPDRKVIIKLKYPRSYIGPARFDPYIEMLGDLPKNVILTDERRPYEIMKSLNYSFSGLSTVVGEALQMGMLSFFIDAYRPDQDVFFRDFKDLCVSSADMAIKRILDIEAGTWTYPHDRFTDLIDLSGSNPFDVIRTDVGLPPWPDLQANPVAQIS